MSENLNDGAEVIEIFPGAPKKTPIQNTHPTLDAPVRTRTEGVLGGRKEQIKLPETKLERVSDALGYFMKEGESILIFNVMKGEVEEFIKSQKYHEVGHDKFYNTRTKNTVEIYAGVDINNPKTVEAANGIMEKRKTEKKAIVFISLNDKPVNLGCKGPNREECPVNVDVLL